MSALVMNQSFDSRGNLHPNRGDSGAPETEDEKGYTVQHGESTIVHKSATGTTAFPWMNRFQTLCRGSLLGRKTSSLRKLMAFFRRNVIAEVTKGRKIPSHASEVKELITEALMLIAYIHRFENSQEQNRASYLSHVSDLLGMLIDMELAASRFEQNSDSSNISTRLISCLNVYLENSAEHLLETLMKVELMDDAFYQILDPIILKILKTVPPLPESELMYVRHILVYRLWKKIHTNKVVKDRIVTQALTTLGSGNFLSQETAPTYAEEEILPRPAEPGDGLSTKFYLCQQTFDDRRACERFFQKYRKVEDLEEADNHKDKIAKVQRVKSSRRPSFGDNNNKLTCKFSHSKSSSKDREKSINVLNIKTNKSFINVNIPLDKLNISGDGLNFLSKKTSAFKSPGDSPNDKNNVVLIDLTDDVEPPSPKPFRKLNWLQSAKRCISKPPKPTVKAPPDSGTPSIPDAVNAGPEPPRACQQSVIVSDRSRSSSIEDVAFVDSGLDSEQALELSADEANPQKTPDVPKPLAIVVPSKSSTPTSVITSVKEATELMESENTREDAMDGLSLLAAVSQHLNERQIRVKPPEELQAPPEAFSPKEPTPVQYIVTDREGLETNDNANVILNGETVVLLKKSPFSNLYIINKAVDEDGYLLDEEVKPEIESNMVIKPDPDAKYLPPPYLGGLPHQNCGCPACVSCCRQCNFLPPPPATPKDFDAKLPLKKRRLLISSPVPEFEALPDLGATVEVTTTASPTPSASAKKEPRRRAPAAPKKLRQSQPKKSPAPKRSRSKNAEALKVYDFEETDSPVPAPKKPRKSAKNSTTEAQHQEDSEWNPNGSYKRKKKRGAR